MDIVIVNLMKNIKKVSEKRKEIRVSMLASGLDAS